jgi:hypothetical protein
MDSVEQITVAWRPQPGPQSFLFHTDVNEILLAGSRGSGKSAAVLGFFAYFADKYGSAARGLIIRRKLTEMHELLRQAHDLYAKSLVAATPHTKNVWAGLCGLVRD